MKFGIFDHVDRSNLPLAELFDKRIEYVKATNATSILRAPISDSSMGPIREAA